MVGSRTGSGTIRRCGNGTSPLREARNCPKKLDSSDRGIDSLQQSTSTADGATGPSKHSENAGPDKRSNAASNQPGTPIQAVEGPSTRVSPSQTTKQANNGESGEAPYATRGNAEYVYPLHPYFAKFLYRPLAWEVYEVGVHRRAPIQIVAEKACVFH